jgi:hypothetical protein
MIGIANPVTIQIYERLKHIVDGIYRKKGMTSSEIRQYFLKESNMKKILHYMGDLKYMFNEDNKKRPLNFDDVVKDILFYRVLLDRIYAEKDDPESQPIVDDYENFVQQEKPKKPKATVFSGKAFNGKGHIQ